MGLHKLTRGRMALPLAMALCVLLAFGCSPAPTAAPAKQDAGRAHCGHKAAAPEATNRPKSSLTGKNIPLAPSTTSFLGCGRRCRPDVRLIGSLAEKDLGVALPRSMSPEQPAAPAYQDAATPADSYDHDLIADSWLTWPGRGSLQPQGFRTDHENTALPSSSS